ncbi:MAG: hypothetical protein N2171_05015 [Clostridia bacterium]|nr:hypothetical protein [Clostridia bacterium]
MPENKNKFFDTDSVASATDCTGLIPTPPVSDAQAESYTQLHSIPKTHKKRQANPKQIGKQ